VNQSLHGIFAPISTPFIDDEVAYDQLKFNVQRYARTNLTGLFALGSNGENPALHETERLKIFEMIMEARGRVRTIIAGVNQESTSLAIRSARILAGMGADYISILTPSYFKRALSDEAHTGYFQKIADALTVPILIYNAPGHTGITLSPKVIETLSQHPNIAGMKDVAPGMFPHYIECASEKFSIIAGTLDSLLPAMMLGAVGGVVSLANPFPEICCELFRLFEDGQLSQAKELYQRLLRLNRSIAGTYGVSGVKAAMDLNGYFGGDPRLPLLPINSVQKQNLIQAVDKSGILSPASK
jgi:4-hydroxy-2-oxoglutarate aldolase